MTKPLQELLRDLEKAAQVVLDELLQEIEDDSDIYTIKDEGENK
jgi:hypothetical protein